MSTNDPIRMFVVELIFIINSTNKEIWCQVKPSWLQQRNMVSGQAKPSKLQQRNMVSAKPSKLLLLRTESESECQQPKKNFEGEEEEKKN